MHVAIGSEIYYCFPDENGEKKLFLTVHPDNDSEFTIEEQAIMLADLLNRS